MFGELDFGGNLGQSTLNEH